jgi:hypothetical protein
MEVTLHPVSPTARYLEYKNQGFSRVGREIIVFLDTDVIPEPGWLRQILLPFLNPGISVVAGNVFIDQQGLYARAVALFWFFPSRTRDDGLRPTDHIFVCNAAFRRDVFARFPLPAGPYFRADVYKYARAIWAAGIPVVLQMAARAAHPPPRGACFVRRALCQGHDFAMLEGEPGSNPPLVCFMSNMRRARRRIAGRRREIDGGWGTVAVSAVIALTYYSLVLCGHVLSRTHPQLVRRYFAI